MLKKIVEDSPKAFVFMGYIYSYLPCQNLNYKKIEIYIYMNSFKNKNNPISHNIKFYENISKI